VLKVDAERRRIGLSIKQSSQPTADSRQSQKRPEKPERPERPDKGGPKKPQPQPPAPAKTPFNNPFAAAFGKK